MKWNSFIKAEFFKQFAAFGVFFAVACVCFIGRPQTPEVSLAMPPPQGSCDQPSNSTSLLNSTLEEEVAGTNCTEEEMVVDTSFGGCYLLATDSLMNQVKVNHCTGLKILYCNDP